MGTLALVVDEQSLLDADLVRRQPHTGRLVHRLDHRRGERGDLRIDLLDVGRRRTEHGVAVGANRQRAHRTHVTVRRYIAPDLSVDERAYCTATRNFAVGRGAARRARSASRRRARARRSPSVSRRTLHDGATRTAGDEVPGSLARHLRARPVGRQPEQLGRSRRRRPRPRRSRASRSAATTVVVATARLEHDLAAPLRDAIPRVAPALPTA